MRGALRLIGGALGLGSVRVAQAIAVDLRRALGAPRRVLVVGDDLGRALADEGLPTMVVSPSPRRRKRAPPTVVALPTALPLDDGTVDAACLSGVPEAGIAALRECARAVRPGGVVALAASTSALLRRVAPPEVMAAMLIHATLIDVEQRQLGTTWLTTARVPTFR